MSNSHWEGLTWGVLFKDRCAPHNAWWKALLFGMHSSPRPQQVRHKEQQSALCQRGLELSKHQLWVFLHWLVEVGKKNGSGLLSWVCVQHAENTTMSYCGVVLPTLASPGAQGETTVTAINRLIVMTDSCLLDEHFNYYGLDVGKEWGVHLVLHTLLPGGRELTLPLLGGLIWWERHDPKQEGGLSNSCYDTLLCTPSRWEAGTACGDVVCCFSSEAFYCSL